MIPKKIHYCWLSGDPYPPKIQYCIDSWHKVLPDYEFVLWDANRFPIDNYVWVKEAFDKKKYAFAADYIRMYAVYCEGGIYLDCDVEVLKRFDDLLQLPYFVGKESFNDRIEVAAFGAEKGTQWVKECLDYYEGKHFINTDGTLDTTVMPDIVHSILSSHYIIKSIEQINEFDDSNKVFCEFPNDWFCANVHINTPDLRPKYIISSQTYCVHHFANSWVKTNKIKLFLRRLLVKIGLMK